MKAAWGMLVALLTLTSSASYANGFSGTAQYQNNKIQSHQKLVLRHKEIEKAFTDTMLSISHKAFVDGRSAGLAAKNPNASFQSMNRGLRSWGTPPARLLSTTDNGYFYVISDDGMPAAFFEFKGYGSSEFYGRVKGDAFYSSNTASLPKHCIYVLNFSIGNGAYEKAYSCRYFLKKGNFSKIVSYVEEKMSNYIKSSH